jgi:hypothetical protein
VYLWATAEDALRGCGPSSSSSWASWQRAVPSPALTGLAWTPGGGALCACAAYGTLHVWRCASAGGGGDDADDAPAAAPLATLPGGARYGGAFGVAASPAGLVIATASAYSHSDKAFQGAVVMIPLDLGPLAPPLLAQAPPPLAMLPDDAGSAGSQLALVASGGGAGGVDARAEAAAAAAAAAAVAAAASRRAPGAALWDAAWTLRAAARAAGGGAAAVAAALAPLHAPLAATAADATAQHRFYDAVPPPAWAAARASVALRRALLHGAGSQTDVFTSGAPLSFVSL